MQNRQRVHSVVRIVGPPTPPEAATSKQQKHFTPTMSEKMSSAPGDNDEAQLSKLLKESQQLGLKTENMKGFHDFSTAAKIALLESELRVNATELRVNAIQQRVNAIQQQTKHCVKATIENTYYRDAHFHLPPLTLNEGIDPSAGGHKRAIKIRDNDGNEITVNMEIPEAKIVECGEGMWIDDMKEVGFPTKFADGSFVVSVLGSEVVARADGTPFEYVNEIGVQVYCQKLIQDALSVLGLTDKWVKVGHVLYRLCLLSCLTMSLLTISLSSFLQPPQTHLEVSIYLLKPDIILVLKYGGRIMFVVEVKSPEHEDDDRKKNAVYGSQKVAGQIWSYLYAMRASGVKAPMGAIMTYNRIAIVTLDDLSEDEVHLKKVEKTREVLRAGKVPEVFSEKKESEDCSTRKESPMKATKPFVEITLRNDDEMKRNVYIDGNDEEDDDEVELTQVRREVYRSKVFEKEEVFPCLVQALHIAYQYAVDAPKTELVNVRNCDPIGERLVFYVGPSSFDWKQMPATTRKGRKLTAIVKNEIPNKNTLFFSILGSLGDGGKATVYLACSTGGRACAIKDYWLGPSSAPTDAKRYEDEETRREKLYFKAVEEAKRWGIVYKDRFNARVSYLGGKPSLIMPYGYEITDDRFVHIPAIRDELQRLAEMEPGFVYAKKDMRWRHVLLDAEGEVFLCDLESLVELEADADPSEVVYEQLLILLRPMFEQRKINIGAILQKVAANFDALTSAIDKDETLKAFLPSVDDAKSLFPANAEGKILTSVESLSYKAKVLLCMFELAPLDSDSPKTETSVPELCETETQDTGKREHSDEDGRTGKRARNV